MVLLPEEVFTPATPVQDDMFAARRHEDLEDRVELSLSSRGRQVILYGDTGVGKTSLVNHLTRKRGLRMIRVECGDSFEDMLHDAVAKVNSHREIGTKRLRESGSSARAGIPIVGVEEKSRDTEERHLEPAPRSAMAGSIDALEDAGCQVLFFDNYENVLGGTSASETERQVAQLLKSLADRSEDGEDHIKLVVAGIPAASEQLVGLDEATARRTTQIEVTRMPADELDQILVHGEVKLGITFEGFARHLILAFSDGFPYYTHLLALHASRRAVRDDRTQVTLDDFDAALGQSLSDCDLALRMAYERAVETTGQVRIRRSIMEAVASHNETEIPFSAIGEGFLQLHPEYEGKKLNFLSAALGPLKEEYAILADRGRPGSTRNMYRFRNPLMRGYVRLRMRNEKRMEAPFWNPLEGFDTEAPTVTSSA